MKGLIALAAVVVCGALAWAAVAEKPPAGVPEGYKLLYAQDFKDDSAVKDFVFSDPSAWKMGEHEGRKALEFTNKVNYKPKVRSPRIFALVANLKFGDFVLDADLRQTGREYGHRDMCLFYGFTDPSKFYYTHIATKADANAHNCFIVNDKPRTNIAKKTTKGIQWGTTWHKVRLVRKGSDGTIQVFWDDMTKPIMEANDTHFNWGWVGFGSFDDTGMIGKIRIWGPEAKRETCTLFKPKE